jgi:hypothetical protein
MPPDSNPDRLQHIHMEIAVHRIHQRVENVSRLPAAGPPALRPPTASVLWKALSGVRLRTDSNVVVPWNTANSADGIPGAVRSVHMQHREQGVPVFLDFRRLFRFCILHR